MFKVDGQQSLQQYNGYHTTCCLVLLYHDGAEEKTASVITTADWTPCRLVPELCPAPLEGMRVFKKLD